MMTLADGLEHGTPEGYVAGCTEVSECPAYSDHGMACFYAHLRAQTDPRYYRAKVRDPRPAAIAKALGFTGPKPDKPAPKIAPPSVEGAIVAYAARKEQQERDAAIARAKPRREPIPSVCPECAAGKHTNCDGTSWCQFTDQQTTCSCTHDPENTPTQEHTMAKETEPTSTPATKPKPPTPAPGSGRSGQELAEIRFWARSNGHYVASHGRIPRAVLAAYDEAVAKGDIPTEAPTSEPTAAPIPEPAAEDEPPAEMSPAPDASAEPTVEDEPVGEYDYAAASDKLDETRERIEADPAATEALTNTLAAARIPESTLRPEWAEVTTSQDVERARDLAVRLEGENAILLEQLDTMGTALGVALRSWASADEELRATRTRQAAASTVRIAANRHLLETIHKLQEQLGEAVTENELHKAAAHEVDRRIAELVAEVDRLSARRWWQLGGKR